MTDAVIANETTTKKKRNRKAKTADTTMPVVKPLPKMGDPEFKPAEEPWLWNTPEAKLWRCADHNSTTIDAVASDPERLAKEGLTLGDITAQVVSAAKRLHRMVDKDTKQRVEAFNGFPADKLPVQAAATTTPKTGGNATSAHKPAKDTSAVDEFGSRLSSISHTINAAITMEFRTAKEISDATGVALARVKAHFKWLQDRNLVVVENGSARRNGEKPVKVLPGKTQVEYQLFEMPVTAIFRYAGAKGLDFDATALGVETLLGKAMKGYEAVCKTHYAAGKKGKTQWGEVPELTEEQVNQLTEAAK